MNTAANDAYLDARVDLMAQRLLPEASLRRILHADMDAIPGLLQPVMPGQNLDLPLAELRRLMNRSMYLDFQCLLRPLTGNRRRFLRHALRWFELANLKVLIRGKFTGVSESALQRQLVDLGEYADLPNRTLIETDDPFEMLRLLEQTAYGSIVRQARRVFEEQGHDLFSLDSAVDRNFFLELAHHSRLLSQRERGDLRRVLGDLMDRFNLLWLLRYRFAYDIPPARAFYLLTATGTRLPSDELMRLARMGSMAEVIEALPPRLKQMLDGVDDIYRVEQVMEWYYLAAAERGLGHQWSEVTRVFSYLLLREAQNRYLLAIIKGKQLGFDDRLIGEAVGDQD